MDNFCSVCLNADGPCRHSDRRARDFKICLLPEFEDFVVCMLTWIMLQSNAINIQAYHDMVDFVNCSFLLVLRLLKQM